MGMLYVFFHQLGLGHAGICVLAYSLCCENVRLYKVGLGQCMGQAGWNCWGGLVCLFRLPNNWNLQMVGVDMANFSSFAGSCSDSDSDSISIFIFLAGF